MVAEVPCGVLSGEKRDLARRALRQPLDAEAGIGPKTDTLPGQSAVSVLESVEDAGVDSGERVDLGIILPDPDPIQEDHENCSLDHQKMCLRKPAEVGSLLSGIIFVPVADSNLRQEGGS